MKNFETFLKKIGVKSDIISKLSTEDEINVDEFAQSFKTNIREVMSNDPDFIQPIKDEIRGTELGKLEHKVKKTFALTSDDVKDKKFDEILQTALDKTKSSGSTTNDDLQNKIIELTETELEAMDDIRIQDELSATVAELVPATEEQNTRYNDKMVFLTNIRAEIPALNVVEEDTEESYAVPAGRYDYVYSMGTI